MRFYLLLSFVLLLSLGALSILENQRSTVLPQTEVVSEVMDIGPMGMGSSEDKEARIQYEYERLVDPNTGTIPAGIRKKELDFAMSLPVSSHNPRDINWVSRGPSNIGGRTRALVIDVTDEQTMLVGAVSGGVWRTTDGGSTYTQTNTPDQLHNVTCLAQDVRSGKENVWYFGTGENRGNSADLNGDGIYKSTDGGLSWSVLPSTATGNAQPQFNLGEFNFVWRIVTDPSDTINDVVLAAVYGGIYRSADGGVSWNPVLGLDTSSNSGSRYVDLAVTDHGIFYATMSSDGPDEGIYRSEDGINWVDISPNALPNNYNRIAIGIAPSDQNQVYFFGETGGVGINNHSLFHYTYLSGNGTGGGGLWSVRTANLPNGDCAFFSGDGFNFNFGPVNTQSSYNICVSVKPDDPNTVFLGGTNVYRSTSGFSSPGYRWIGGYQCDSVTPSNYIYENHHPDIHDILFLPSDPDIMFTASDGGVHRTDDCLAPTVEWQSLNHGYQTTQFYTVAIEPGETWSDIVIGGMQDNGTAFTNTYLDDPWEWVFYGDGAYCAITPGRDNYYLSWQTGKTFKFEIADDGTVLGLERIDPTGGGGNYLFINPFILDPLSNDRMYLGSGRYIWRNDSLTSISITGNEYQTIPTGWIRISETNTGFGFNAPRISAIAMSESDSSILYYGTTAGGVQMCENPMSSTPVVTSIDDSTISSGYVSSISVDRFDPSTLMVSFSNYGVRSVFYSEDNGQSWSDVSGNLEENPDGSGNGPSVPWVHIYSDADTTFYLAGTTVGLFSTGKLEGQNTVWSMEGASTIGNVPIHMITSRAYDGSIVIGTHGRGIFSQKLNIALGNSDGIVKTNLDVHVFPNPAREKVWVQMESNYSGEHVLQISDAQGRIVFEETLFLSADEAFRKELNLQAVNAGMYQITLAGERDQSTSNVIRLR